MAHALQPGERIGPYTAEAELGRGGMGAVYRAVHTELGHAVALKVILPEDAGDEESRRRFQREAMAAARLKDEPGIVGVRDYGEDGGRLWFAMPLLDGRTLEDEIEFGDLHPVAAAERVAAAAHAVHRAHAHGVIHRDLKPANILVDSDGTVWVNDFGLARFTATGGDADLSKLTRSGFFVGTPNYMAPEQIHGTGLDGRADVYGLGATLFDALTGRPPFDGGTLAATLTLVMRANCPAPSKTNPAVPAALDAIALRCLAKAPADRYPSALALAEDLERFAAGETVSATQAGMLTTARKSAGRHRSAWLAGAGVAVAAAGLAAGAWWLDEAASDKKRAISQATAQRSVEEEAQARLDVWAALSQRTAAPMRLLQDRLFGVEVSEVDREAALQAIRTAAGDVERDHPESRLPAAWVGLAQVYADQAADGFARIDGALRGGDDPLCHVVLARAHCARFLSQLQPPAITMSEEESILYHRALTAEMEQDISSAEHVLAQAKSHRLWSKLAHTSAVVRYEEVLRTLLELEDKSARPPPALQDLLDDPLLADEIALLEGFAHLRGRRPRQAADAFHRPAHRRWPGAIRHTIASLLIAGHSQLSAPADRLEALDQAEAILSTRDLEVLEPWELAQHHGDFGMVHWMRSILLPAGDPRVGRLLDQATAEFDRSLEAVPEHREGLANSGLVLQLRARQPGVANADAISWLREAVHRMHRAGAAGKPDASNSMRVGVARVDLARRLAAAGEDPREMYRRAIADFDTALKLPLANPSTLLILKGSTLHDLGKAVAARGESPMPVYRAAAKVFQQSVQANGKTGRLGKIQSANLFNSMAVATEDLAKRAQLFAEAESGASEVLQVFPQDFEALQLRGLVRRHLAQLALKQRRDPVPLLRAAEEDYSRAIGVQPGLPQLWSGRGLLRYQQGVLAARAGGDGRALLESAINDFDAALDRHAGFPEASRARAACLAQLKQLVAQQKGR